VNEERHAVPYHHENLCNLGRGAELRGNCHSSPGFQLPSSQRSIKRIALFHYATRSLQDFNMKMLRKGANGGPGKSMPFFDMVNRHASGPLQLSACELGHVQKVLLLKRAAMTLCTAIVSRAEILPQRRAPMTAKTLRSHVALVEPSCMALRQHLNVPVQGSNVDGGRLSRAGCLG
jgi:hypothetical protein